MEENWQAELNTNINSKRFASRNNTLNRISLFMVLLLGAVAIPALISGTQDNRSRAAEVTNNTLKMNLNIPICSTQANPSCGFNSQCASSQEGATCEHRNSCQNSISSNDLFICQKGKWVYTTTLKKGYCNLCNQTSTSSAPEKTNSTSPTPTIFQGPTMDPYLHRPLKSNH